MRAPVYCLTQWVSSREGCLCTPAPPCEVHRIHTVRIYLTGRGAHTTGGGASSMLLDAILSSTGGGPSKDASAPRPPCSFHQITVLSQYQTADLGSPLPLRYTMRIPCVSYMEGVWLHPQSRPCAIRQPHTWPSVPYSAPRPPYSADQITVLAGS
jgi:hypothetical protein